MTDLIASAHEGLATPDPRRLAAIEQRLLEQSRQHGRKKIVWWWLVGALVAGAASALWWAMDYDSGEALKAPVSSATAPSVAPSAQKQPAQTGRSEPAESKPAIESDRETGPMIYQRER